MSIEKRLEAIRGLNPHAIKESKKLSITEIEHGGYLEFNNQTWKVVGLSRYLDVKWSDFSRRKSDYWVTELEIYSLNNGKNIYLEWEQDDSLELSQTLSLVKIRDIQYQGRSLRNSDIEDISEEEGTVVHNGISYHYEEDETWAGLYFKSRSDTDGLPMRAYEFESDDERCLTIELWLEDGDRPDREAFISQSVKPNEINVIQQAGMAS